MLEPSSVFEFESEVLSATPGEKHFGWTVPTDLPYFEGHFPGKPVLPAVATIDASCLLVLKSASMPLTLSKMKSAKFLGLIEPGMELRIILKALDNHCWEVKWLSEGAGAEPKLVANLQLQFTA